MRVFGERVVIVCGECVSVYVVGESWEYSVCGWIIGGWILESYTLTTSKVISVQVPICDSALIATF